MVTVMWHGYEFAMDVVGNRVMATCTRTGHQRLRLCEGWLDARRAHRRQKVA